MIQRYFLVPALLFLYGTCTAFAQYSGGGRDGYDSQKQEVFVIPNADYSVTGGAHDGSSSTGFELFVNPFASYLIPGGSYDGYGSAGFELFVNPFASYTLRGGSYDGYGSTGFELFTTSATFTAKGGSYDGYGSMVTNIDPSIPLLVSPSYNASVTQSSGYTFTWFALGTVASYTLQISSSPSFSTTIVDQSGITTASYSVTTLSVNATYYWRVNALSTTGVTSFWSDVWSMTVVPVLPPSFIVATGANAQVAISWTASPSTGVTQYALYRGLSSGNLSLLATTASLTYTDATVTNCTLYFYAVKARTISSESSFSQEVSATPQTPATITVIAPNGGEQLQAGLSTTITWNYTGCSLATVTILYSIDNGANWNTIASSVTNTGSYLWSIPNTPTTQALVQISNPANATISDQSNTVFTIVPVAPPATLTAAAGSTSITMSWSASSSPGISGYNIYRGTSSDALSLLATTASVSYSDLSAISCTQYYYAVRTRRNSVLSDFSPQSTATIQPTTTITVLTPNGGEAIQVGQSTTITWSFTGCNLNTVTIEYSTNNTLSWSTIASAATNSGTYSWTIPTIPTTQAIIRISDPVHPAINDGSNSVFAIIRIAPPTAIAATASSTQATVSWSASSSMGITGYEVFRGTASGALFSVGTTTSLVYIDHPTASCTPYYYAVRTLAGSLFSDLSMETSATVQPVTTITVIAPNGGETLQVGLSTTMSWSSIGCSLTTVRIEYSTTNGISWNTIISSTSNSGSYLWSIPNIPSNQALIRISDATHATISDASNTIFTIQPLAPVTNVMATTANGKITLSWNASTSFGVNRYDIYRGISSGNLTFLASTTNALSFIDTTPLSCTPYYYSVLTVVNGIVSLPSSEATITIRPTTTMSVSYPNGNEKLQIGVPAVITWSTTGCDWNMVKIEYSTNNGVSWSTIVSSTSNTASFSWMVPNTPTTRALVRISDVNNASFSDQSNQVFTIQQQQTAINLKVFLEGPYDSGTQTMRVLLASQGLIPQKQPFTGEPFNYAGTDSAASIPSTIVDWILLEFRAATNASLVIASRAAFLRGDGGIVDLDGISQVLISPLLLPSSDYYIAVKHRNHLSIMSATTVTVLSGVSAPYSFITDQGQAFSSFAPAMKVLPDGSYGMVGGDGYQDGIINAHDRAWVRNYSGATGYHMYDINLDGIVNSTDRVLVLNNNFRASQVP